jgi:hypothetical protein
MATAFYGTIVIVADNGRQQVDRFTNTDVTLAYCLFDSQGGTGLLPVKDTGYIKDLILNITAAGTTLTFKLIIDGVDTGIRWVQSASFPTINNRFFNSNPVRVAKGQTIQIQAIT